MIHFLSGILRSKSDHFAVVDVGGVGFYVTIPYTTYRELPPLNEALFLFTSLQVREDEFSIYGFFTEEEREMFEVLISVSGVGAKMAVDVISHMPADQFIKAVQTDDVALLCQAPGIGKKRAERLIFDLKNSKHSLFLRPIQKKESKGKETEKGEESVFGTQFKEAIEALIALGLKPVDAQRALTKAKEQLGEQEVDVKTLIKESLKYR